MMRWIILGLSLLASLHAQLAYGQVFERIPLNNNPLTPGGGQVIVGAFADADAGIATGDLEIQGDNGLERAEAGAVASDSSDFGSAIAQVAGVAATPTPLGGSTGIPLADADLITSLIAEGFALAAATGQDLPDPDFDTPATLSTAIAEFVIDGAEAQYLLHGTMHLLAAGSIQGFGDLSDPPGLSPANLSASIGPWFVNAVYQGGGEWAVNGQLPGGVTIDETTSALNDYYNFSVPVANATELQFISNIILPGGVFAGGGPTIGGDGQLNYVFSADSWAYVTALGDSPVLGDVDGDGEVDIDDWLIVIEGGNLPFPVTLPQGDTNQDGIVNTIDFQNVVASLPGLPADFNGDLVIDGSDFLAWQRGYGITSGAQISDGDADFNGTVDSADLALWQLGFGISLPSPLMAVPEPTSLALVAVLAPLARRVRRLDKRG